VAKFGCKDDVAAVVTARLAYLLYPRAFALQGAALSALKMPTEEKIRVLVAKPGLDGHDRGAKVIARALRDAGMEVIYTGLRQTPEMIVSAAVQEDVNVIGLSILSGAHNAIVPRVMDLLKQNKMDDVIVIVGGIIPDQDVAHLKEIGVAAIFQPGTSMDTIVQFIRGNIKPRSVPTAG
jgi:methylmalonyl-CoA mutase C-terminal domain/subunit